MEYNSGHRNRYKTSVRRGGEILQFLLDETLGDLNLPRIPQEGGNWAQRVNAMFPLRWRQSKCSRNRRTSGEHNTESSKTKAAPNKSSPVETSALSDNWYSQHQAREQSLGTLPGNRKRSRTFTRTPKDPNSQNSIPITQIPHTTERRHEHRVRRQGQHTRKTMSTEQRVPPHGRTTSCY
jgi:hypothetical protein